MRDTRSIAEWGRHVAQDLNFRLTSFLPSSAPTGFSCSRVRPLPSSQLATPSWTEYGAVFTPGGSSPINLLSSSTRANPARVHPPFAHQPCPKSPPPPSPRSRSLHFAAAAPLPSPPVAVLIPGAPLVRPGRLGLVPPLAGD